MYTCNVHTVGIYTNVLLACMYVHTHVFTYFTYMCKCTTCLFVHAFICMYYVIGCVGRSKCKVCNICAICTDHNCY